MHNRSKESQGHGQEEEVVATTARTSDRLCKARQETILAFGKLFPSRQVQAFPLQLRGHHPAVFKDSGGPAAAEERLALAGTGSAFRTQNWVLVWPYTGGRARVRTLTLRTVKLDPRSPRVD